MTVLRRVVASGVLALSLTACASGAVGPGPLADVAAAGDIESRARDYCESHLGGNGPIVAAYDSTSGEVRDLAVKVETRLGWDDGLPIEPTNYAAVCIYDISGIGGPVEQYDYQARWAGEADGSGGIGLITMW